MWKRVQESYLGLRRSVTFKSKDNGKAEKTSAASDSVSADLLDERSRATIDPTFERVCCDLQWMRLYNLQCKVGASQDISLSNASSQQWTVAAAPSSIYGKCVTFHFPFELAVAAARLLLLPPPLLWSPGRGAAQARAFVQAGRQAGRARRGAEPPRKDRFDWLLLLTLVLLLQLIALHCSALGGGGTATAPNTTGPLTRTSPPTLLPGQLSRADMTFLKEA